MRLADEYVIGAVSEFLAGKLKDPVESRETAEVLLTTLGWAVVTRDTPTPPCSKCGRATIVADYTVTHLAADGGLSRGCRAASWTEEDGHDDALPARWYATR